MILDPVYLVAPELPPPSMPTRRAFLWIGVGTVVGFGSGALLGPRPDPRATLAAESADVRLRIEWAEELACAGSDADLLRDLPAFLGIVMEAHSLHTDGEKLWQGVRRACALVRSLADSPASRVRARALARALDLRPAVPDLRECRREMRRIGGF
ncbi:MAG: hypothetical protein Fur0037_04860 [Planctomycetota bacterium]